MSKKAEERRLKRLELAAQGKGRWLRCPQCDEGKRVDGAQCGNCHGTMLVNVARFDSFIDAARSKVHGWEPSEAAECEPVRALPGSERKVEELARRVQAGEPLWNDKDGLSEE